MQYILTLMPRRIAPTIELELSADDDGHAIEFAKETLRQEDDLANRTRFVALHRREGKDFIWQCDLRIVRQVEFDNQIRGGA